MRRTEKDFGRIHLFRIDRSFTPKVQKFRYLYHIMAYKQMKIVLNIIPIMQPVPKEDFHQSYSFMLSIENTAVVLFISSFFDNALS